jgi:hypothetical protein
MGETFAVVPRYRPVIAGGLRWRKQRWNGRDRRDPAVHDAASNDIDATAYNHPTTDVDATAYNHAASDNDAPSDHHFEHTRRR